MERLSIQAGRSAKTTPESHHQECGSNAGARRQAGRWSIWTILCIFFMLGYYTFYRTTPPLFTTSDASQTSNEKDTLRFNYTCLPSQACWPSTSQWAAFNYTINGNLKLTVPWAEPCFTGSSQCESIALDYMNSSARTAQYGAMEFLDWETCGQSSCTCHPTAKSDYPQALV